MIILMCIIITPACIQKYDSIKITHEQSDINIEQYVKDIKNVVNRYGYDVVVNTDEDVSKDESSNCKYYKVSINKYEYVLIDVGTLYINELTTGIEAFSVEYVIEKSVKKKQFNIDLYTDIVNCLSGFNVDREICTDLVYSYKNESKDAPPNEYKRKNLTIDESWYIFYELDEYWGEVLNCGGITKASTPQNFNGNFWCFIDTFF